MIGDDHLQGRDVSAHHEITRYSCLGLSPRRLALFLFAAAISRMSNSSPLCMTLTLPSPPSSWPSGGLPGVGDELNRTTHRRCTMMVTANVSASRCRGQAATVASVKGPSPERLATTRMRRFRSFDGLAIEPRESTLFGHSALINRPSIVRCSNASAGIDSGPANVAGSGDSQPLTGWKARCGRPANYRKSTATTPRTPFFDERGPAYNLASADQAWERTTSFLQSRL